jgi:hypothetical protein
MTGAEEQRVRDRADALDVLIAYRRKELELYQARLERGETQAAGLITGALAVSGLAATVLTHNGLDGPGEIAVTVLGGIVLLLCFLAAFTARDSRARLSWWFPKVTRGRWLRTGKWLIRLRSQLEWIGVPLTVAPGTPADPLAVRKQISDSLGRRCSRARKLAAWREDQVRIAALLLVGGTALILLAIVLAAT